MERFPNLIDRYGVVFFNPSVNYKLPTITGFEQDIRPGVKLSNRDIDFSTRIINLVASNINLNKYIEIDEINIKHSDYIKLILHNNAEVRIPRFTFEANLNKLATIIKIEDGQGRNIKSVDLTVDSIKVPCALLLILIMANDLTAVLEIGTYKFRCLVGEVRDDQSISAIGYAEVESQGIRKGEIFNRDKAILSLRKVLRAAEENIRKSINSVVLVLSGGDTRYSFGRCS